MRPLVRNEVLDDVSYRRVREDMHRSVLEAHRLRMVSLSPHIRVLFENRLTLLFLLQETIRDLGLIGEEEIRAHLEIINQMLGEPGDLPCTLLIEIEDEAARRRTLRSWRDLPEHLYLQASNGDRFYSRVPDPMDQGELSLPMAVNLIFNVGGQVPVRIGCNHPELKTQVDLTAAQLSALTGDLQNQNNFDAKTFSQW